jgi:hypothetical protein
MEMKMTNKVWTNLKLVLLFIVLISVVSACKKKEGYGGKSTIYGKVLERKYNNSGVFQNEYYIPEKRVYIVFGDEDFYGDEVRTDFEGKYKFSFLYAGNYTIYTYSECSPVETCDSGIKEVRIEVKVLDNGDVVVGSELVTENW